MSANPRPDSRARAGTRDGVTRRRFLTGLGVAAGAAVVGGYGLSVWARDDGASGSEPSLRAGDLGPGHGARGRTLVVIELGGGNDGLNTVVPMSSGAYHDLRPTLGITDAIALDEEIGLAPSLPKLAARFRAGQVAVVEGLGYERYDLSHFGSFGIWWSAAGGAGTAGWLGRYLDGTVGFDDPLAGVSIGPTPSPALLGSRSFSTSIADATGLFPNVPAWAGSADDLLAAWNGFAPGRVDPATLTGRVQGAIGATGGARAELDRALGGPPSTEGTARPSAARGGRGYAGDAVGRLALAGELAAAPDAPRVVYVSGLGDFDVHQGLAQRHPALLEGLDAGLDALLATVEQAGRADQVLVMTVSEFGRRPAENGGGTDHGTAAPHFLVGPAVRGGRYGEPPDLARLDRTGNLAVPVDFRRHYATALAWLGVEPEPVLGADLAPIPALRTL